MMAMEFLIIWKEAMMTKDTKYSKKLNNDINITLIRKIRGMTEEIGTGYIPLIDYISMVTKGSGYESYKKLYESGNRIHGYEWITPEIYQAAMDINNRHDET